MPPKQRPNLPAGTAAAGPGAEPVLPVKSREETDLGWGERFDPDDDERLLRERPPHWDLA